MTSILQPHLTPPRPREKLLSRGVQSLEDVELIALLLGTGQPFLVAQLGGQPFETFGVIFLDNRHRLIRFERLFSGSLTQTAVYPREVARRGLQLNAAAVIVAHNHPSGTAESSQADQLLTTQLRRTLAGLEIALLDHLIVAGSRTISAGEV